MFDVFAGQDIACDNTDVWAWLDTYVVTLRQLDVAAENLASVTNLQTDQDSANLVGQAEQTFNNFTLEYGEDWEQWGPPGGNHVFKAVKGSELNVIKQIIAKTDQANALKKAILDRWHKLAPSGAVPQGNIGTNWAPEDDHSAAYGAAGVVLGLGFALAVIAARQKSKTPKSV